MATKYSRQREEIKHYLSTRRDHPTADQIYLAIRQEIPNISLGTVYRNLTFLADSGEILRLRLGNGADHFDYDTSDHHHFVCSQCNSVSDLDVEITDSMLMLAKGHVPGRLDGCITYFYGICQDCCTKESETNTKAKEQN